MYEQKEGTISLFKNEKKTEKAPDYKGTAKVNGEVLEVSMWLNESKNGVKYMAGHIKKNDYKKPSEPELTVKSEDGDLPF